MIVHDTTAPLDSDLVEQLQSDLATTKSDVQQRHYRHALRRIRDWWPLTRGPTGEDFHWTPAYAFTLIDDLRTAAARPGVSGRDIYLKLGGLLNLLERLAQREAAERKRRRARTRHPRSK